MKKTLISTFIAAACLTASGVAMAGDKEAVEHTTVTTNVSGVSGITITLTDNPENVTTEEVKNPGVTLTTLGIEATGLTNNGATGGSNIAVEVGNDHFDSATGAWLFKNNDGSSTPLKARPKGAQGWNHDPADRVGYRLNGGDSASLLFVLETNSGNTNVTAGGYSMPLTVSYNTW
ncbi:hypothetical protein CGO55_23265 [Salmonella enterica]|uniref:hypothetical protein n=1 Tax=Enterobacteriaceae TaxID=543 RepID=UPI0002BA6D1F|nr:MULTISPECIES: hypothetical protein [Enterobacteriaceae]EAN2308713.1 hypothetical protein [Salmonella enterica]EBG6970743.1 hypothetical protein [Salmonella enterica subsp. enterica]EBR9058861.1 hypothetical protein [Salmonella enterica subsp. enterica serovar Koketime]EBU8755095.1 hypothetical protein [Salmonella enterica subsp. enterica serovar Offa]EBV0858326.1 hypothetical protein [Salmonella enterica subsp. enterica serovar Anecho]EBW5295203.1 hypothetical protein [Salmonella enterica 